MVSETNISEAPQPFSKAAQTNHGFMDPPVQAHPKVLTLSVTSASCFLFSYLQAGISFSFLVLVNS